MAERHPSVRKYRDALETAINRVMDYVSDAHIQVHQPGHHIAADKRHGFPTEMTYSLDRALTDPPTPGFLIPSPQASRGPATGGSGGSGGETPRTPDILGLGTVSDGRTFSGLFAEDFWAGDAFSLHIGESFGLRM